MSDRKREVIHIDREILREIIEYNSHNTEYKCVENNITGSDPEDGGSDHDVVIQRKSDGKYFGFYYTDWDMFYNFERDFPEDLEELFPKTITKIIFE